MEELWAGGERKRRDRRDRRRRPTDDPRGDLGALWASSGGRALIVCCLVVLLCTAAGLLTLLPAAVKSSGAGAFGGPTQGTEVTAARLVPCGGGTGQQCRQVDVRVEGRREKLTLGPVGELTPSPQLGTNVRVTKVGEIAGVPAPKERHAYADLDRRGGLAWLGLLLAVVAVVTLRLRGALAALGVVGSVGLVVTFLIPAMLGGSPAVSTALVCALAVTVITHGLAAPSLVALLGITVTLLLSAGLLELAVRLVSLDGRSNEIAGFLAQQQADVSLRGIVLAGC